jgi:hypothetical protein
VNGTAKQQSKQMRGELEQELVGLLIAIQPSDEPKVGQWLDTVHGIVKDICHDGRHQLLPQREEAIQRVFKVLNRYINGVMYLPKPEDDQGWRYLLQQSWRYARRPKPLGNGGKQEWDDWSFNTQQGDTSPDKQQGKTYGDFRVPNAVRGLEVDF